MTLTRWSGAFVVAALIAMIGCGGSQRREPAVDPGPPPGGMTMMADGKPVWPPSGPGCDAVIPCCKRTGAQWPDAGMMCQMSLATRDCPETLRTMVAYLEEQSRPVPPECQR